MAFNIGYIHSALKKYGGPSRKAYFIVRMTPPKCVDSDYSRDFEVLCSSASLPGVHFDTMPIRPKGYGNIELRPYNTTFNNITCDLILDVNGKALEFLHQWMGNMNNFGIDVTGSSSKTQLGYYEFAYPEDYETTISIIALDNYLPEQSEQAVVVEYRLNQAFPITIGDVAVNWNSNDEINYIPVTFAYNTWSAKTLPYTGQGQQFSSTFPAQRNQQPAGTTVDNSP